MCAEHAAELFQWTNGQNLMTARAMFGPVQMQMEIFQREQNKALSSALGISTPTTHSSTSRTIEQVVSSSSSDQNIPLATNEFMTSAAYRQRNSILQRRLQMGERNQTNSNGNAFAMPIGLLAPSPTLLMAYQQNMSSSSHQQNYHQNTFSQTHILQQQQQQTLANAMNSTNTSSSTATNNNQLFW